jgi:hypothetical protein
LSYIRNSVVRTGLKWLEVGPVAKLFRFCSFRMGAGLAQSL